MNDEGDSTIEMSPGSSAESYPAFALNELRENLNQDLNPGTLVSRPGMLILTSERLKAYKVLARPVLMYGSDAWSVRNSDVQRLTTVKMRFLRRIAGYSLLDHKRNELIAKELKITPIYEHLNHYRQKWLNHVNRMDRSRLSRQILRYIPHGRRSLSAHVGGDGDKRMDGAICAGRIGSRPLRRRNEPQGLCRNEDDEDDDDDDDDDDVGI
ncbi:hypothetical protein ANN_18463 [Periplaneta americana]|uniref:Uncharacterized protein n=1 Tax=Periplaneta americana TaxID=6978 RepID=A0ABQ8SPU4_PERAM|nr:hypothetical protein ANN_18463 [Periplaneta americana]